MVSFHRTKTAVHIRWSSAPAGGVAMANKSWVMRAFGGVVGGVSLLVFLIVWCAITGTFDYIAVRDIQRQSDAVAYPTVVGRIIDSQVRHIRSDESDEYSPVIR